MTDQTVWLVTGAGRGLGVHIARAALDAGHAVVATARSTEAIITALGEHEVARPEYTDSRNPGGNRGTSERLVRQTEPVVTAAQIQSLPELTGYVAFAEDRPIAKFVLKPISFVTRNPSFVEYRRLGDSSPTSQTSWGNPATLTPWSTDDLPADPTQG